MKVKEESEKVRLKLNIQKTKIVASRPITSCQIDGKTVETVTDFLGGAPKWLQIVTAAMKLKTLIPWKEVMANLDSVLKNRDITLSTKVYLVKAMVFSVAMYGCENWTIKTTECWRIDDFELWCWSVLLRVPWTAKRSNKSILKEISPEYSLEGLMLKLKLQYFGHLMQRTDSFEKTLMLGKIESGRRRGWQRMRWLDGITDSFNGHEFEWTLGVGDEQGGLACCSPWGCKESNRTERLNWLTGGKPWIRVYYHAKNFLLWGHHFHYILCTTQMWQSLKKWKW